MALLAIHSTDETLRARLEQAVTDPLDVAQAPSWQALDRLVRERPVSAVILDTLVVSPPGSTDPTQGVDDLERLRARYPSVGLVLVARDDTPLELLLAVGRAQVANLRLLRVQEMAWRLRRELDPALGASAIHRVPNALKAWMARPGVRVVRAAMETLHRQMSADDFARHLKSHRPQLSERLRTWGLPSVGRVLMWGRLLQGAAWLGEPGRNASSVARQLEYSDGAAFRRALRNRMNATPSQVVEGGGLSFALEQFRRDCLPAPAEEPVHAAEAVAKRAS